MALLYVNKNVLFVLVLRGVYKGLKLIVLIAYPPLNIHNTHTHLQFDGIAKQLVPIPVEVAVHMAAVSPLAASRTLVQGRHVLVRRAGVTRRVVAALGVLFHSYYLFLGHGVVFLNV